MVAFLLAETARLSVGAAKGCVAELRSLLRFLYLDGRVPLALAATVPPVAGWHDTGVPAGLAAPQVQRLLDCCDRTSSVGARDFAMLVLVARLGLRSAEVARLELDDIDWRAGEIVVRGKGPSSGPSATRRRSRRGSEHPPQIAQAPDHIAPGVPGHQGVDAGHPTRPGQRRLSSGLRACRRAWCGCPSAPSCAGDRHAATWSHVDRGEPGAPSPGPRHHRRLRKGRLHVAAQRCPTVARGGTMSALTQAAADYLRLRQGLGHDLADAQRLLPRFVAYLDTIGAPTVTIEAALAWAQQPNTSPASSVWPRRMSIARGFARYMAGIDARTEVPPLGLVPSRQRWRPAFIYSPAAVAALMGGARLIRWRLPAATHETLIGLLAATGLRVGEALKLDRSDVDWADGVLSVRESKFKKSRKVPVLASTLAALEGSLALPWAKLWAWQPRSRVMPPNTPRRQLCRTLTLRCYLGVRGRETANGKGGLQDAGVKSDGAREAGRAR